MPAPTFRSSVKSYDEDDYVSFYADAATAIENAVADANGTAFGVRLSNYDFTDALVALLRSRDVEGINPDPESGGACVYGPKGSEEYIVAAVNDLSAALYDKLTAPFTYPTPEEVNAR